MAGAARMPAMTRKFVPLVLLLLCLCPVACAATPESAASATASPARPTRVLLVGNSYTFYNGGLPAIVHAMAESQGKKVECVPCVSGGKSLEWHYTQGQARDFIANKGPWDVVVLQDYSLQPINKRDKMLEYARKLDADVKRAGASTVFFMTWARQHQPEKQQVITDAYETIAAELGADVAPVGLAWERVLTENPDIKLHTEDKSHPTPAGSYLAACVIYRTLFGEPPTKLPRTIEVGKKRIDLSPEQAELLQRVAAATTAAATAKPNAKSKATTRPAAAAARPVG